MDDRSTITHASHHRLSAWNALKKQDDSLVSSPPEKITSRRYSLTREHIFRYFRGLDSCSPSTLSGGSRHEGSSERRTLPRDVRNPPSEHRRLCRRLRRAPHQREAIIEHNTGETVTWKQFNTSVSAFAAKLLSIGLVKGDVVATSLPLLKEHVYLIYACYRIGVIIAPLDLRLKAKEIITCMGKIKPKAYFFLGKTPVADFRPIIREVMAACPSIRHWVQFQKEADLIMDGAVGVADFVKDIKKVFLLSLFTGKVRKARRQVGKRDAALIIFTTGSTGSPKPALLCHENILLQNIALCVGFELEKSDRMLINLPPSHVGCTTEQLGTILFGGGVAVILHIFDPKLSLEAIEKHKVTIIGQIPALFNMEWRLPDYRKFDLSSLRFAIYGGQAVPREFLVKMKAMAPRIGTGLGLTETAGFCTYTNVDADVDDSPRGSAMTSPLCPLTIRHFMNPDGTAGAEKPGEVGEICFSGPQIFLGYLGDPGIRPRPSPRRGSAIRATSALTTKRGFTSPAGRSSSSNRRGIRSSPRTSNATSLRNSRTRSPWCPSSAWSTRSSARGSWPSWNAWTVRPSRPKRSSPPAGTSPPTPVPPTW